MSNTDKRTATQRIEDLEKVLTGLYQAVMTHRSAIESLASLKDDMPLVKEALKLINKRVEATIQAANPESGITAEAVSAILVTMNVADLTAQVQGYLANGHVVPAEYVADGTFLVCEEYGQDGTLTNPRVQFRLDSQDAAIQETLKGKKAGDMVSFGESKFTVKVLEVYALAPPNPPQAEEQSPAQENVPSEESAQTEAATETASETQSATETAESTPETTESVSA